VVDLASEAGECVIWCVVVIHTKLKVSRSSGRHFIFNLCLSSVGPGVLSESHAAAPSPLFASANLH
jgi:hypothetical protein